MNVAQNVLDLVCEELQIKGAAQVLEKKGYTRFTHYIIWYSQRRLF
jgi:hypothetical protein